MSTRLALRIFERPDPQDPSLSRIRLHIWASFVTWEGDLTPPKLAIIDTGAPLSMLPSHIWHNVRHLKMRNDTVQGIVPNPDCDLQVVDAVVSCVLYDDEGQSSEALTIRAYLAPTQDVPLLLGFGGLLDQADVYFSLTKNLAYLEIQPNRS